MEAIPATGSFVHLADVAPRPALLRSWERVRHRQVHWLSECVAEFTGVFIYTFAGTGSAASYVVGNILAGQGESISSNFQIGIAYGLGLLLACLVCASTSGGHFNPVITILSVLTKKFSLWKGARYIIAQILGCYVACLVVYVQYHRSILKSIHTLDTAGTLDAVMFTPKGPAGIFAFYAPPDSNLGQVLVNEFFCDFIFGVITWAALDPTNILVSPALMPWVFGMTLTLMIWSYAYVGVALNSARDVGGRFAAMTLWGTAASGGSYALLASLTNIPGVILGAIFYEVWFTDTSRVVTSASLAVFAGTKARQKHCEERDSKFGSLTVLNKSYAEGKSNMSRESQVSQDDQSSIAVESRSA